MAAHVLHLRALRPRAVSSSPTHLSVSSSQVTWHGVDPNVEPTWESQAGGHPAYLGMMATNGQGAVFIAFNPHPAPVAATLPGAPGGTAWNLVAATAPSGGVAPPPGGVVVGGLGLVALEAVPVGA